MGSAEVQKRDPNIKTHARGLVAQHSKRTEALEKMARDIRESAASLTPDEVRFAVDLYYQVQDFRIMGFNRLYSALDVDEATGEIVGEPHALMLWVAGSFRRIEDDVKAAMLAYAESRRPGRWALSIHGIGPVIAAGLLAHIDITRAPTVGHIWSFAGLNPNQVWEKGQKRPWNAKLKVLCWKIGQSFMKQRGSANDVYGKVYAARKELEVARNAAGNFSDQAAQTLERKAIRDPKTRAAYEGGKLPDGRIELRAERYAVKLFLSHLHHVMYEAHFGTLPPKPYVLTQGDHAHFLAPPLWPCE